MTSLRVISDDCVSCGACESECPVSAIAMGNAQMEINPNMCAGCGICQTVCPVGAITEE